MIKSAYDFPRPRVEVPVEGPTTMIVRPDLLRTTVFARVESLELGKALALLESAIEALARAAAAALPGAAVVMRGFELRGEVKSKSRGDDLSPVVTGTLDVPVAEDMSYWQRTRAVATIHTLLQAAAARGQKLSPPVEAGFGAPTPVVRDPERFRTRLIERWLGRVRELSTLAQAAGAGEPLRLHECAAPGPVTQRSVSLDEVELQLDLRGALVASARLGE